MARNRSPEENDPSFHRANLSKHIDDIKRRDPQKGIAYEDFIKKLMEIFTDNPPHSWRFRATKNREVFFRVHRIDTGKTKDFLLPLHDALIIMSEFLDEKYRELFPGRRDYYGNGDKAPINYETLSESLRQKYLDAIKSMAIENDKWRIDANPDAKQFLDGPVPFYHLPNKSDIEFAYSQLQKTTGNGISIEAILDQVEVNFNKSGKRLKPNWQEITRENIKIWFGQKGLGG